MSKLSRVFQKIFAGTAASGEIGEFGSFAAGSPATTTDAAAAQSLSNFDDGWFSAVVGENAPAIEDMNAVHFVETRQLAYLFQQGVPEWDVDTTYYIGSVVAVGAQTYVSRINTNLGHDPSNDPTNWRNADLPAGVTLPFGGSSAPDGYLLCDGSVKLRTDYPHLFSAISTSFNTGGESGTQFRLPLMARRVIVGAGGSGTGTLANTVGSTGGEETHTLITAELAAHTHGGLAHTHGYSGTTSGQSTDHTHTEHYRIPDTASGGSAGGGDTDRSLVDIFEQTAGVSTDHTHTYSGNTDSGTITTTASTGSGTAHNNMQPSIVMNYIIKT